MSNEESSIGEQEYTLLDLNGQRNELYHCENVQLGRFFDAFLMLFDAFLMIYVSAG
jgi:hypothetical protein